MYCFWIIFRNVIQVGRAHGVSFRMEGVFGCGSKAEQVFCMSDVLAVEMSAPRRSKSHWHCGPHPAHYNHHPTLSSQNTIAFR